MKYYLDTEFNEFGGELLSLALVREDGDALYLLYPEPQTWGSWVYENVFPILESVPAGYDIHRVTHDEGAKLIADFLHSDDPADVAYVITDWPDDVRYMCSAIITGPGQMVSIPRLQFDIVRVDAYPTDVEGAVQHNALWDALALRSAVAPYHG